MGHTFKASKVDVKGGSLILKSEKKEKLPEFKLTELSNEEIKNSRINVYAKRMMTA